MRTPKQVISAFVDALNTHDADAAAALYHEDAVNIQMAIGTPLEGKSAIHADLINFFRSTPDTYTHIENLFEDGDWAILEWSGGGTFIGNEAESSAPGRKYTLRGCGFFHVVDGKIRFQRGYWDKLTWFKQVGLPID
ncbi:MULTISPECIES: nuclear transport factor 2 family protein [Fischerella]|uniref:Polyketide cyclase n=1 Tax=Fischerella muscicola CCMEE 5323 TaxID=2019572 RepID=A0A2N6JYH5_FISMU|nr:MULTISPECIES: ester cyclase [Fischerella]MBD2434918.1 ester cyclase [Fischerella sp. FACHB-380]PLZ85992.1 polyketide cyclase [Fischerella muscicola CCMEE 5323]